MADNLSRKSQDSTAIKEPPTTHIEAHHASSEEFLHGLRQRYPLLADASKEKLDELNKRVLRKLDRRFLPVITMMLLMNYLDRGNVSNARLAGMQRDLHMNDVEWSAGISMFYVGYIISQIPSNIVIAKSQPRYILPSVMLAWSAVTICMPAAHTPWAFMLARFLIGVCEGPFLPGVALLTSSWYTKSETPIRMAIWHAGNIVSNIFSGLLAAAILTTMNGISNLASWKWFFLIEGIVSFLVAFAGFYAVPNFPNNNSKGYFDEEELQMAQYRQLVSAGGISEDEEGGYWDGFAMAVKDPFTWMFAGTHFSLIICQSFKDFFPSIVNTLGFSKTVTYLIQAPPYLVAYISTLLVSWSSGRRLEHCFHMAIPIMITMVGAIIMISTLNVGARYFSLFLLCTGPYIGLNLQIPWETTVIARPRTKRASVIAIANCVSSVSHWFTPYFFLRSQAPRYETGGGCIIVGCGMTVFFCLLLRFWVRRKNKEIEAREAETGEIIGWRYTS